MDALFCPSNIKIAFHASLLLFFSSGDKLSSEGVYCERLLRCSIESAFAVTSLTALNILLKHSLLTVEIRNTRSFIYRCFYSRNINSRPLLALGRAYAGGSSKKKHHHTCPTPYPCPLFIRINKKL
jgi:hypothetical protein